MIDLEEVLLSAQTYPEEESTVVAAIVRRQGHIDRHLNGRTCHNEQTRMTNLGSRPISMDVYFHYDEITYTDIVIYNKDC